MKISSSIDVVIPAYNSEKTIALLVNRLESVLDKFDKYRIIIVDDKSSDNVKDIIKQLTIKNKNISAIYLEENQGQQRASFIGLKESSSDYVVLIDDDLNQSPEDIMKLYDEIEGYDVVYGISKEVQHKRLSRKIGSLLRDHMFYKVGGLEKPLKVCTFRIMTRDLVKKIIKTESEFVYISMEILKHTKNIGNIFVKYNSNSPSNYNLKKLISIYFKIYKNYKKLNMKKRNE